ncbi:MAG: HD domain-containing phosphohydrolase [bacterium]
MKRTLEQERIKDVLKETIRNLNAERGSLMLVDNATDELYIQVSCSTNPETELKDDVLRTTRVKIGKGISGIVAKTQKPLIINDIRDVLEKHPDLKLKTDPKKYKTSLIVPVIDNGRTIAVINIINKLDNKKFSEDDLHLATMLARYCRTSLKLKEKNEQLIHINEIIREINKTNILSEIYELVVRKGAEILKCKNASIMLVEQKENKDPILTVKESTNKSIVGRGRKLGEGVSGWVWKTGEPVLIKSIGKGEKDRRFEIMNKPGSFIVVPLNLKYKSQYALNVTLRGQSTIGVLNFTDKFDNSSFTFEELDLIINYANLVAIALEKAHFYRDAKQAYLTTVQSLSTAIESKDTYTCGHSENVAKYAVIIAKELKMDSKDIENINLAAALHDIGKIGVSDVILTKPAKLTREEYKEIKKHVTYSESILSHSPFLDDVRYIIRHHHERLDGTGYPDGLKGQKIPLGSRILAVADSYDAMTSKRPYRDAMPKEKAILELRKCSGSQFDPDIVEAFIRTL